MDAQPCKKCSQSPAQPYTFSYSQTSARHGRIVQRKYGGRMTVWLCDRCVTRFERRKILLGILFAVLTIAALGLAFSIPAAGVGRDNRSVVFGIAFFLAAFSFINFTNRGSREKNGDTLAISLLRPELNKQGWNEFEDRNGKIPIGG
jgi:hypothetical protein